MLEFRKVATRSDLTDGRGTIVSVDGTRIALFLCDGAVHAIKNQCPHMGGDLGEGALEGTIVRCPWHGWKFDVRTGVSPHAEVLTVRRYEVRVEGEDVYVAV